MKVQVTRDSGGVSIWHDGVELAYGGSIFDRFDVDQMPKTGKAPFWINTKFSWMRKCRLFNKIEVEKYFPELEKDLTIGENRTMILSLITID